MDDLRFHKKADEQENQNRESRFLKGARLAYGLTRAVLPAYAHPKSPHYFTLPQLAACVLLAGHFGMSHRAMTEWLQASEQVCEILELPRVPDHSTLSRTKQKVNRKLLQSLSRRLREQM